MHPNAQPFFAAAPCQFTKQLLPILAAYQCRSGAARHTNLETQRFIKSASHVFMQAMGISDQFTRSQIMQSIGVLCGKTPAPRSCTEGPAPIDSATSALPYAHASTSSLLHLTRPTPPPLNFSPLLPLSVDPHRSTVLNKEHTTTHAQGHACAPSAAVTFPTPTCTAAPSLAISAPTSATLMAPAPPPTARSRGPAGTKKHHMPMFNVYAPAAARITDFMPQPANKLVSESGHQQQQQQQHHQAPSGLALPVPPQQQCQNQHPQSVVYPQGNPRVSPQAVGGGCLGTTNAPAATVRRGGPPSLLQGVPRCHTIPGTR